ncbi:MAG: metal ABC transporter solute-binding protein, Zn/Mn family, partial [Candidatus Latescibacterota bacterium]
FLPGSVHSETKPLAVAVSIPPQKYFAERIGGSLISVTVMTPPGADPHTYEPRPRQLIELSRARLYFAIGVPFENAWLPRLRSMNSKLTIVPTDKGIQKIPMTPHSDGDALHRGERHEVGPDVHIWLSPPLVRTVAAAMRDALVSADPAHADEYRANFEKFRKDIDALDAHLAALFSTAGERRKFIVFHPAWGYFARTYNLVQIPVEIDGKEPKPAEIMRLVKLARAEGITVIFIQPQFSARSARTIADAIGGKLVIADDLSGDWDRNLRTVAEQFKSALR